LFDELPAGNSILLLNLLLRDGASLTFCEIAAIGHRIETEIFSNLILASIV